MTIRGDYAAEITALENLATDCDAAADAITNPASEDAVKKTTLQKAADNCRTAVVALRGPGSTNTGPTERTLTLLNEYSL
jgi:hypothetical protein